MNSITASQDTWLKRSPAQSRDLSAAEKQFCTEGKTLEVSQFKAVSGGHWEIWVDGESNPWYIYDVATHGPGSHWNCSWEVDSDDDDEPPEPQLIQRAISFQAMAKPVGKHLKPADPFDTLITPHFTYGELCKYAEARRFHYADQCETAYELCVYLEDVREHFGGNSVVITSGHRPPAVNRSIGGATYSEHLYRAPGIGAVDFYIRDVDTYEVEAYCDRTWNHSVGYGAKKGFVHLGIGRGFVRWPY